MANEKTNELIKSKSKSFSIERNYFLKEIFLHHREKKLLTSAEDK